MDSGDEPSPTPVALPLQWRRPYPYGVTSTSQLQPAEVSAVAQTTTLQFVVATAAPGALMISAPATAAAPKARRTEPFLI
jgi:hypothetical protein